MRELSDVLEDAVAAAERSLDGLTPGAGRLAEVRGRVRRRRAVRHTVQALAAVPLVAAVGVLGVTLADRPAPPPPAETSSPDPTPDPVEPTPEPTEPTPGPTEPPAPEPEPEPGPAPLGDPVLEDGLPPYHRAPEGVLAQAGPGWTLVTWFRGPSEEESAVAALFLVDPEGVRYRLPDPPLSGGWVTGYAWWVELLLVDWEPGATTAVVQERQRGDGGDRSVAGAFLTLDLTTGSTSPLDVDLGWPDGGELLDERDGVRLWVVHGTEVVATGPGGVRRVPFEQSVLSGSLSPDGRYALLRDVAVAPVVVDLDAGSVVGPASEGAGESGLCASTDVLGWWAEGTLLRLCFEREYDSGTESHLERGARLVLADVEELVAGGGTLLRVLGPDDVVPMWSVEHVRDGLVAAHGGPAGGWNPYSCPVGPFLLDATGDTALPLTDGTAGSTNLFLPDVAGSTILVRAMPGCSGEEGTVRLLAYDVSGGDPVELVGPAVGDAWWVGGVTSYVLGR